MKVHTKFVLVLLLVKINGYRASWRSHPCDLDKKLFKEGNIGESGSFKWLGVLRVHIHDKRSLQFKVALTGLVLVSPKCALVNAADVVSIPLHIFQEDSKAYFITEDDRSWTCKPKSYTAHPEFEYSTYVSVALVELDIGESGSPLEPICWPEYSFNTSSYLYATGFTDENQLLEKVIYNVQYVNRSVCDEFYNRDGTKPSKYTVPLTYHCGYAVNNKKNCVWENGMVLASNSTGPWTLIGFGIRGPGCAGPTRFIDMYLYMSWIESSIDLEEIRDYDV